MYKDNIPVFNSDGSVSESNNERFVELPASLLRIAEHSSPKSSETSDIRLKLNKIFASANSASDIEEY